MCGMGRRIPAEPGQWLLERNSRRLFQIVGVDPDERCVDIQYADGSLDAACLDDLARRDLTPCQPPEGWGDH
jgi:hypothetical protein